MTTEEAVRRALHVLVAQCDTEDHLGPMIAPSESAVRAGRAALALPITPSRVEWRLRVEVAPGLIETQETSEHIARCLPSEFVESRIVPEAGPWLPCEVTV